MPEDVQGDVEPSSQSDVRAWWRQWCFRTLKLYPLCIKGNCRIVVDRTVRGETENVTKLHLAKDTGTVKILKMVRMSKSIIMLIIERAIKILVGLCNGRDILSS